MHRSDLRTVDEGKRVIDRDGNEIGQIVDVQEGTGFVEPDWGWLDRLKIRAGLRKDEREPHLLDEGSVDRVTAEAVHLRGRL